MMTEQIREKLINRVTALRGENKSRAEMAKTLNGEGLKTPAGKDWTDVLIGAFMNRMSITNSTNSVKTEAKEIKTGKETNYVAKTKGKTKVFKRQETVQGKAPGVVDQDLLAIIASVIQGPLTREQKFRAFSALI